MHAPLAFFKFGVKASLNAVLFGVGGDLVVEVLPSVAKDIWNWWGKGRKQEELRAEVQAVAQLPDAEARQLVEQAVAEEASNQPNEVRAALTTFLTQVPAAIRQSQRRPADPTGRTVAASVSLSKPDDVLPFLPARLPRFKPGARPGGIGDWELEELLGVGGFGEVWRARNKDLGDVAALKFCCDARAASSLRNEVRLLGQVQREGRGHSGIVQLRHTYLNAEVPCLEYEYVAGGDLSGLIQQWHRGNAPNLVDQTSRLLHSLAQIVAFAHQLDPAIIHRDLKPANILLQPTRDGRVALRVADFGIGAVAARQAVEQTRGGTTRGQFLATALRGSCTPLYASPQQKRGDDADPRDDVYALGVIWYQLLTGDVTAEVGGDWRDELSERSLSDDVLRLLSECLASRPERRLADAGALATRLGRLLAAPAVPVATAVAPHAALPEDDLAAQVQRTLTRVQQAHAQARQLAEQQHDYAAAVRVLDGVPEHLRDAALYATACARRDRAAVLDQQVREAVKALYLNDLAPTVEELLQLAPGRADLRRLLETLPKQPREITNSIGMKLVLVPKGRFWMGSPETEEGRSGDEQQHEVEITKPFYLGIHPVTQAQYQRVMGSNPSVFCGKPNTPVEQVSWEEAVAFCKKLSEIPEEKRSKRLYSLPTEAQWEYSCRGGASSKTTPPFYFGASLSSKQANFDSNLKGTCPVGSYPPNAFGLFDMHENVWEWCNDWHEANYHANSPRKDPTGPTTGTSRVLRGGSWFDDASVCRAAYRVDFVPGFRDDCIGFRVVLSA